MAFRGGIQVVATFLAFVILSHLASANSHRDHHEITGSQLEEGKFNTPFPGQLLPGLGMPFPGLGMPEEKEKEKEEEEEKEKEKEKEKKEEPHEDEPEIISKSKEPPATAPSLESLREGFYEQLCPQAENVVNEVINKHFGRDPTLAPAFVRLFFHDCFVTGCDASILLDETPSGEDVEKKAPHNGQFIRGYDVIEEVKARLEAECPGVVSCADILAFTNRDALVHTGVPRYNVAAGRRDGLASLARNVEGNIPLPQSTAKEMIHMFRRKGMSLEEMVVLTGAHSIGTAHCAVVAGRFHDPEKSKGMDRGYMIKMQTVTSCRNETQDIPFDPYSHHKMDARYYGELLKKRALLEADENLEKEPGANKVMRKYANDQKGWLTKYVSATIKMGQIEVLTGTQGQIRKQCSVVNGNAAF